MEIFKIKENDTEDSIYRRVDNLIYLSKKVEKIKYLLIYSELKKGKYKDIFPFFLSYFINKTLIYKFTL
jgi:hypothetical protein